MSGRRFHIDPAYRQALAATGLTTFDDFFEFEGGRDLRKAGLANAVLAGEEIEGLRITQQDLLGIFEGM